MKLVLVLFAVFTLAGCAQPQTDSRELMDSYGSALAKCNGEVGCITALQGAFYSGAFRPAQQDTIGSVLITALPWGRLILEGLHLYHGSSGGGQGFFVKGNNNQFIGFNRASADRSSSVSAPFDATSEVSTTTSWSDMYNSENFRNQQDQNQ